METPDLLAVEDLLKIPGWPLRSATYNAINAGQIPHVRIGNRIRIPRLALDQWLAGAATEGPGGSMN